MRLFEMLSTQVRRYVGRVGNFLPSNVEEKEEKRESKRKALISLETEGKERKVGKSVLFESDK